jgi:hypothetical protein
LVWNSLFADLEEALLLVPVVCPRAYCVYTCTLTHGLVKHYFCILYGNVQYAEVGTANFLLVR